MGYSGPVLDAHIHLYEADFERYPWLRDENAFVPLPLWRALQTDYLLEDFRADIAGQGVSAAVHVDAGWRVDEGPLSELEWLDSLDDRSGLVRAQVAHVEFGTIDSARQIREVAARPRVVGVRQNIQWHPALADANPRGRDITREKAWRRDAAQLAEAGLVLELTMFPWQADEVSELAATLPGLPVVIDHCAGPLDQSERGVLEWNRALRLLAGHPQVTIKLSGMAAYLVSGGRFTPAIFADSLHSIIDAFGADRTMWASDYPVNRLAGLTYPELLAAYRSALQGRDAGEQEAIFALTAQRVYSINQVASLRPPTEPGERAK